MGGSVENRARFARQVLRTVREAVGERAAVTAKLNMADGVPGGLWLEDSVEVARLLEADGALDAITLTGGSSLANPMYLFRGEAPREEFAATLPRALRLGFKVLGHRFMPDYPFEEAFFLPYARQFRAALDMPLILLGGINELATVEGALAEGFSFVAIAHAACCGSPTSCQRCRRRHLACLTVHPLQQMHAHHLQRYPLRPRPPDHPQQRGRPEQRELNKEN